MAKRLEPLYDRIVVIPLERELESEGILLPETSAEKQRTGIIAMVGEGYVSDTGDVRPLRTKPGEMIVFGEYAGIEIEIEGRLFISMREQEVLGVIRDDSNDASQAGS